MDERPQNKHLTPWRPGESGNPGGRPKGQSLTQIIREKLAGNSVCNKECPDGRTVAETIIEAVLAEIIANRTPSLFKEVIARIDGKVPSKVELDLSDGTVQIETFDNLLKDVYGGDADGNAGA